MIGMVVRESRKQRAYAEALSTEKTLLLERRRISNELHDTVLKSLQGLALEAHALNKNARSKDIPFVEERAHYIEEVCNNTSQEIRGVVLELHDGNPAINQDLKQQLSSLVEDWSKKCGISAEIIFRGEPPVLPLKLAHDLRRILGEALANVQRHSCASLVKVLLASTLEGLRLEVSDNGKGFECRNDDLYPFVSKGKLGLVSMKERAEMAGGTINIYSNTTGTTLSVSIPLKK
jgi:signal transduction histidine kinase